MSLLNKLFKGRLNRQEFWITFVILQAILHAVSITLIYAFFTGNPFSTAYLGNMPPDVFFPDFMPAYYLPESFGYWPAVIDGVGLLTWITITTITTFAFAGRLTDIKIPRALAVTYPVTMIWLTFVGFWPYFPELFQFNEEATSALILVIIVYAAGLFTLVASFLPSKK